MIATPSESHPLLVGILVDVSGSMTTAIRNTRGDMENRLQSFQKALGELALRAKTISSGSVPDLVKVFAYGFGFGNPVSRVLWPTPSVVDLFDKPGASYSTVGLSYLSDHWQEYKTHVERLAKTMFGDTPMRKGLSIAKARFEHEEQTTSYSGKILFILSDGVPTDATVDAVAELASTLRSSDVMLVSSYVTDDDITEPRNLYGAKENDWPEGARLMFDCASELPLNSPFEAYLAEYKWNVAPAARLFTQVNQSEVLTEFLNMLLSPVEKQENRNLKPSSGRVFVSYSHKDKKWLDRLIINLSPLEKAGSIDLWHDQRINTGDEWRNEISKALSSASVAILIISADFLASDFIQANELPALLEAAARGGTRVLPLLVKPSLFTEIPTLAKYQSVNPPSKPLSSLSVSEQEEILVKLAIDVQRFVSAGAGC